MTSEEFRGKLTSGEFRIGKKGRIVEDYDAAVANLKRRPKKKENKSRRHSTAVINTYDGIRFKSKLETYCYKWLLKSKLKFKYEPTTFVIQDKEKVPFDIHTSTNKKGMHKRSNTVSSISYTPDFVIYNGDDIVAIIETKGRRNESFPLRIKMFFKYAKGNIPTLKYYFEPSSEKDVDKTMVFLISELL